MLVDRRVLVSSLAAASVSLGPRAGVAQAMMRIRFSFADQSFTAALLDTPPARSLLPLLPLRLEIEDYSDNEEIVRLPGRLSEEGAGPFGDESPGDLCYYAPWGNLALFYAGYRYSRGLIRLGRLDGDVEPLNKRGRFPMRIEKQS